MAPLFDMVTKSVLKDIRLFLDIISSSSGCHFRGIEAPILLKEGFLIKRAQGRKKFGLKNFKKRFFRLTNQSLSYSKHKGEKCLFDIPINDILVVESLAESSFKMKYMFQVVHAQTALYIQASNCVEEKEWLDILMKICKSNKNRLKFYHPAAFVNGHWLCCKSYEQTTPGCSPVSGGLPLADVQADIDSDREVEKIHSLFLNEIDKLDALQANENLSRLFHGTGRKSSRLTSHWNRRRRRRTFWMLMNFIHRDACGSQAVYTGEAAEPLPWQQDLSKDGITPSVPISPTHSNGYQQGSPVSMSSNSYGVLTLGASIEDPGTCYVTLLEIQRCVITLEQEHIQYMRSVQRRTVIGSIDTPIGDESCADLVRNIYRSSERLSRHGSRSSNASNLSYRSYRGSRSRGGSFRERERMGGGGGVGERRSKEPAEGVRKSLSGDVSSSSRNLGVEFKSEVKKAASYDVMSCDAEDDGPRKANIAGIPFRTDKKPMFTLGRKETESFSDSSRTESNSGNAALSVSSGGKESVKGMQRSTSKPGRKDSNAEADDVFLSDSFASASPAGLHNPPSIRSAVQSKVPELGSCAQEGGAPPSNVALPGPYGENPSENSAGISAEQSSLSQRDQLCAQPNIERETSAGVSTDQRSQGQRDSRETSAGVSTDQRSLGQRDLRETSEGVSTDQRSLGQRDLRETSAGISTDQRSLGQRDLRETSAGISPDQRSLGQTDLRETSEGVSADQRSLGQRDLRETSEGISADQRSLGQRDQLHIEKSDREHSVGSSIQQCSPSKSGQLSSQRISESRRNTHPDFLKPSSNSQRTSRFSLPLSMPPHLAASGRDAAVSDITGVRNIAESDKGQNVEESSEFVSASEQGSSMPLDRPVLASGHLASHSAGSDSYKKGHEHEGNRFEDTDVLREQVKPDQGNDLICQGPSWQSDFPGSLRLLSSSSCSTASSAASSPSTPLPPSSAAPASASAADQPSSPTSAATSSSPNLSQRLPPEVLTEEVAKNGSCNADVHYV
ncbi:ras GTPase-activating protein 3 [Plakobranchus ocellatus]|uniref:Ras GTPase-activating protein 3 n=1 Tax=Plakobranchus ocellatus TaxID=259542 RepID=A0AAV4BEJ4_9GAST|nr:ras GTPase-activating protein 3 [Plakobranchus ocellatus]